MEHNSGPTTTLDVLKKNTSSSWDSIESESNDLCHTRSFKRSRASFPVTPERRPVKLPSVKHFSRRKRLSGASIRLSSPVSDLDSSFSSSCSEASDLDSSSDINEFTEETTVAPYGYISPITPQNSYFGEPILTKDASWSTPSRNGPSIFEVPEILYKVIEYADLMYTKVPEEGVPVRRRPLSYRHALLIYGNKREAEKALEDRNEQSSSSKGVLHSCLLVNKLFHNITKEIMSRKVFFDDETRMKKYLMYLKKGQLSAPQAAPSLFVLHKLFSMKQASVDLIVQHMDMSKLEWIEFHMCPKAIPTPEFFVNGEKIKKIVITGSKKFDDSALSEIAARCPNLETVDVRACEQITDSGIYELGRRCSNLRSVNFGRKNRGNLVTDASVSELIKNNPKLDTVGLAGCHITDKAIWDLAVHCSASLQRLSLNNCPLITNQSIPLILHSNYLSNVSVLELRYASKITNFKPIIEFKRRQEFKGISMLIEVCEDLCLKMRSQEVQMDKVISQRIFSDILDFANAQTDEDISYLHFLQSRRANSSSRNY